jgi:hypothetical protein
VRRRSLNIRSATRAMCRRALARHAELKVGATWARLRQSADSLHSASLISDTIRGCPAGANQPLCGQTKSAEVLN